MAAGFLAVSTTLFMRGRVRPRLGAVEDEEARNPAPDLCGPVIDRFALALAGERGQARLGILTVEHGAPIAGRRQVTITRATRMLRLEGDELLPVCFDDLLPGERVEVWLVPQSPGRRLERARAEFVILARQ